MNELLPLFLVTPTLLLLVLGLVGFVLRHQRMLLRQQREVSILQENAQQQAIAAALVAQEAERQRIAAELHDGVGTILALAKLHLHMDGPRPSPEATALIDQAVAEVRRISHNLQPAALQQLGLVQAMQALVMAVPPEGAPHVELAQQGEVARLLPAHELMVYRIAQELLTNGLRHAHAQRVRLLVRCDTATSMLTLTYTDDGVGFDPSALLDRPPPSPQASNSGMGLINLRSRVAVLGGQLTYQSQPGKGTRVEVMMPVVFLAIATAEAAAAHSSNIPFSS
jgi:signal transduction histidine kinase